ncbi:unnamed protein product [Paramecium octaurelia]|uniref:Transmembrane protein n=1 Tax=Paramecium octaurelia TaxID=43137 RepID=A0A8S1XA15_PAROT|nr:unnamed protein product [Paramecium octaurelia]
MILNVQKKHVQECDDGNYRYLFLLPEVPQLTMFTMCLNVCGDGLLTKEIGQCNDGNIQNNDGCSDTCEVEDNWKCQQENNISVCKYKFRPVIILTKLTKSNSDYQEFQLSFSEQMRLYVNNIIKEKFLQMIVVTIEIEYDTNKMLKSNPLFLSPLNWLIYFIRQQSILKVIFQIRCQKQQSDVRILQIFMTILYSLMKNLLIKCQRIINPLFLVKLSFISSWLWVFLVQFLILIKYQNRQATFYNYQQKFILCSYKIIDIQFEQFYIFSDVIIQAQQFLFNLFRQKQQPTFLIIQQSYQYF